MFTNNYVAQLLDVLSKPSGTRLEHEARPVVHWLRSKVKYFREAPNEAMFNLVSECGIETKHQDEVIILEGDVGDTMYIILSGYVDIYRANETESEINESFQIPIKSVYKDRKVLGNYLATVGLGQIFGEIALIEDCPRTASVIAGSATVQIAVVPRDLYNRTVKAMILKEYNLKLDFLNSLPHFSACNPRYKKQLLMALETQVFDYQSEITRQGDFVRYVYWIINGEVRISCEPHAHYHQYINKLRSDEKEKVKSIYSEYSTLYMHKSARPKEICLLSSTEENQDKSCTFGDAEAILGLDTHMTTTISTTKTLLMSLPIRHFDRYIVRRNQVALDLFTNDCHLRYQNWIQRYPSILFFQFIMWKLQPQTDIPQNENRLKPSRKDKKKVQMKPGELPLPPRGPLVDMTGKGTVFDHIRIQYKRMKMMNDVTARRMRKTIQPDDKEKRKVRSAIEKNLEPVQLTSGNPNAEDILDSRLQRHDFNMYSQNALSLEDRMHRFMSAIPTSGKSRVRVESLSVYKPDDIREPPKAGSVIVLRPISKSTFHDTLSHGRATSSYLPDISQSQTMTPKSAFKSFLF